jgi:cell division GTPase FtsZ
VNVVVEGDDMRNIKVFLYKDNISYDLNKHISKTYNVDSVEYVYINNEYIMNNKEGFFEKFRDCDLAFIVYDLDKDMDNLYITKTLDFVSKVSYTADIFTTGIFLKENNYKKYNTSKFKKNINKLKKNLDSLLLLDKNDEFDNVESHIMEYIIDILIDKKIKMGDIKFCLKDGGMSYLTKAHTRGRGKEKYIDVIDKVLKNKDIDEILDKTWSVIMKLRCDKTPYLLNNYIDYFKEKFDYNLNLIYYIYEDENMNDDVEMTIIVTEC